MLYRWFLPPLVVDTSSFGCLRVSWRDVNRWRMGIALCCRRLFITSVSSRKFKTPWEGRFFIVLMFLISLTSLFLFFSFFFLIISRDKIFSNGWTKFLLQPVNNSSENDTLLRLNDAETTKKVEYGTNDCENNTTTYEEIKQHGKENELLRKIKETFDLDLFKDGVYLNIIVGLSLYYVAESNFKLMTPFFLSSIGKWFLERNEI